MLIKLASIAWTCLALAAFLLGLLSPLFAGHRTIWKALGLWGLGLGAGVASVVLSFLIQILMGQERAALISAGKAVPINDMPGYGQVLLAMLGVMYFAALLAIIILVFAILAARHRHARNRTFAAGAPQE